MMFRKISYFGLILWEPITTATVSSLNRVFVYVVGQDINTFLRNILTP